KLGSVKLSSITEHISIANGDSKGGFERILPFFLIPLGFAIIRNKPKHVFEQDGLDRGGTLCQALWRPGGPTYFIPQSDSRRDDHESTFCNTDGGDSFCGGSDHGGRRQLDRLDFRQPVRRERRKR